MEVFRDFFARHAESFIDAPATTCGEQNLVYYSLFQDYLKLYEETLQDYIESLNVSVDDFYAELGEIKVDTSIKDAKLIHFVNYLVACTDYESFYKVMARAAKKEHKEENMNDNFWKAEGKDDGENTPDVDSKESRRDNKSNYK